MLAAADWIRLALWAHELQVSCVLHLPALDNTVHQPVGAGAQFKILLACTYLIWMYDDCLQLRTEL